jgi:protein required for attachment to host cells
VGAPRCRGAFGVEDPAMKHPRTWYVVADGGRARFLSKRDEGGGFDTQREFVSADIHKATRDLGAERPGRGHESGAAAHHAVEPRVDLHQAEKQRFMAEVAAALNAAGAESAFDRLILIAPAPALNALKDALDGATSAKVTGQLQKDLTHTPNADLAAHFADLSLV